MPSNKRWCVEVSSPYWWSLKRRFLAIHLFKTRKAAEEFSLKYHGAYKYVYSNVKKVKR